MSKNIYRKISELVYFTNYIIRKLDNETMISINESKTISVLKSDLDSKIKDMNLLYNHMARSKKEIDKIPDLNNIPEIIVKDLYTLIKLMKHNKIIENADQIVSYFIQNFDNDDKLMNITKIESSEYNISKLNKIIASNIDECKNSEEYKRIFGIKNRRYNLKDSKLTSIKGLNEIYNDTLKALIKSRDSFEKLKTIFGFKNRLYNGSDIFYYSFLKILELNFRLRKYFSFKIMIINKFLDDIKDYYK